MLGCVAIRTQPLSTDGSLSKNYRSLLMSHYRGYMQGLSRAGTT